MSRITITINTDGAAFEPEPSEEMRRILEDLADAFWMAQLVGRLNGCSILDSNGNTCGKVEVTP